MASPESSKAFPLTDLKSYPRTIAALLALWALCLGLFVPFARQIIPTDSDALACVAHIRSTGSYLGWPQGYYFNGVLIGLMNSVVNLFGRTHNDYLFAYKVLVVLGLVGIASLIYFILVAFTRRTSIAFLFALFGSLTPGLIALLLVAEDNVLASFMHTQYLFVYLAWIAVHRDSGRYGKRLRVTIDLILPLSLLLAVISHHQLNVLWVTPLLLPLFIPQGSRMSLIGPIARLYAIAVAGFLFLYVPLTRAWSGGFDGSDYVKYVREWIIPSEDYRPYYFFNEFGWDWIRQARSILTGLGQIMSPNHLHAVVLWRIVVFAVMSLLALAGWRKVIDDYRVRVLLLFIVIHLPHSLVYESYNIERWDVIIPPAVILIGLMCHELIEVFESRERPPAATYRLLLPLAVIIGGYHIFNYWGARMTLNEQQEAPWNQRLSQNLKRNVSAVESDRGRRFVLILPTDRIGATFLYGAAYYDYRSDLFVVSREGEIFESKKTIPVLERVSGDSFAERTSGATLLR